MCQRKFLAKISTTNNENNINNSRTEKKDREEQKKWSKKKEKSNKTNSKDTHPFAGREREREREDVRWQDIFLLGKSFTANRKKMSTINFSEKGGDGVNE